VIGESCQGGVEVQRRLLQGWLDQLPEKERAKVCRRGRSRRAAQRVSENGGWRWN
jgi:hypothetical protein